MRCDHLAVPVYGRIVEVPRARLSSELARRGPIASLALVEAIIRAAPRDAAISRLRLALDGAGTGTNTLAMLLGFLRLSAREAIPALQRATASLPVPLSLTARVVELLLAGEVEVLCALAESDDHVAQRTPLVLTELPAWSPATDPLATALLAALARLQPALGITAYRAMLGDLAEAFFRALQRGADPASLVGPHREELLDRLCAELPGTPDLVAARGMAWLLGAIAPQEDAIRSAIERARARFRDPAFYRDCGVMLGEAPSRRWPPRQSPG